MHVFAGASGIAIGTAVPVVLYSTLGYRLKNFRDFFMDVPGKPGSFETVLARYIKTTETVLGIAAGSIVLLVGSSTIRGPSQKLAWFFATPLFLLAYCILYGVLFSVWMNLKYEAYQHGRPYTRRAFVLSNALGFSALFCFVLGYVWLIFGVTG